MQYQYKTRIFAFFFSLHVIKSFKSILDLLKKMTESKYLHATLWKWKVLLLFNYVVVWVHFLTIANKLTFSFWSICGDTIENVDQDKEKCDEQSHPSGNDIGRNDETDPGDHDE